MDSNDAGSLTAEEMDELRADVLAWQKAADGSDTKALLGLRMLNAGIDVLPRLLATLNAERAARERCCVESGCPHGFVVGGSDKPGPYVGTSLGRVRELEDELAARTADPGGLREWVLNAGLAFWDERQDRYAVLLDDLEGLATRYNELARLSEPGS